MRTTKLLAAAAAAFAVPLSAQPAAAPLRPDQIDFRALYR